MNTTIEANMTGENITEKLDGILKLFKYYEYLKNAIIHRFYLKKELLKLGEK